MQETSNFFTNGFSIDSSRASQNMHLKYFDCWEFMILIPSITVSRFGATRICIFKVLRYTAILWEVGPNVTRHFD